jgi:apolipoprotein D and lipocalin family protein
MNQTGFFRGTLKFIPETIRPRRLAEATKAEYLDEGRRQGFDLSNLIGPRHTGREVRNAMVEDL